jgi:hypothetical protein
VHYEFAPEDQVNKTFIWRFWDIWRMWYEEVIK